MKKMLMIVNAVLALTVVAVLAEINTSDNVFTGDNTFENGTVKLKGTLKIGETTMTVSGAELNLLDGKSAVVDAGAPVITVNAAVNVTNAQDVTLQGGVNVINPYGGTNTATATITLVRPTAGVVSFIVIPSSSTNKLAVAASGTWNSGALELTGGDAAILFGGYNTDGVGTNAWHGQKL
jgi:hypothetical protein